MPEDIFSAALNRSEVPAPAGISTNYTAGGLTYLKMVQLLRRECGVSGNDPSGVNSLSGEMARLAGYIQRAWIEIQTMHDDWLFMKQPVHFSINDGQQKYTTTEMMVASFGNHREGSYSIYPDGQPESEQYLTFLDFDQFRSMYLFGAGRTQKGRPQYITISSQGDLLFGPTPDASYQVHGEGWAMPSELEKNEDRPACPPQFHWAIIYKAMMYYGMFEAAPEVLQAGADGFKTLTARMAAAQLPTPKLGGPLI